MSKSLKFGIIVLAGLCLALLALILMGVPLESSIVEASEPELPNVSNQNREDDLIHAVEEALESATGQWAVFDYLIDHIQVQDDGQVALVWLAAIEIDSGKPLGREPELALAELGVDGTWEIYLEDSEPFDGKFRNFQYAEKSMVGDLIDESQVQPKSSRVFGGYYLPWAAGLEKRLTWSVAHTSCTPTYYCTHAFDFADGTMFPMVAAKGGTVYHWKDTCANGNSSCTNSITLEDRSTTPWTYQIYLHIAQGSVPNNLKQVGAPVLQGQYIADVDDTGYSTGHHVHFMVVAENTRYMSWSGYVWGMAEDITFRDVDINWDPVTQGGRPRLKYEADFYGGQGRTYYTSGNQPAHPPTGGLTTPTTKTLITNPQMSVTGWGQDDISVSKYEILGKYETDWVTIKEVSGGSSFSTTVNLCDTDIPDGPFKLALRVWDYEGNPSEIKTERKLIKDVVCGPVGSEPIVTLQKGNGQLVLSHSGFVGADVIKGSMNNAITSVEFWFHGPNWTEDNWIYLGKDQNGSNGWQAPFTATYWPDGSSYIILAVATDSAGNQDADVVFNAIMDRVDPTGMIYPLSSPVPAGILTINWTAADDRAGIDTYLLEVSENQSGYRVLETALPAATTSYSYPVGSVQTAAFRLTIFDKAGNSVTRKVALYTEGYVFPKEYIYPKFPYQPGE